MPRTPPHAVRTSHVTRASGNQLVAHADRGASSLQLDLDRGEVLFDCREGSGFDIGGCANRHAIDRLDHVAVSETEQRDWRTLEPAKGGVLQGADGDAVTIGGESNTGPIEEVPSLHVRNAYEVGGRRRPIDERLNRVRSGPTTRRPAPWRDPGSSRRGLRFPGSAARSASQTPRASARARSWSARRSAQRSRCEPGAARRLRSLTPTAVVRVERFSWARGFRLRFPARR